MKTQPKILDRLWDPLGRQVWRGMYDVQNKHPLVFLSELKKDKRVYWKQFLLYMIPFFVMGALFIFPGSRGQLLEVIDSIGVLTFLTFLMLLVFPAGWRYGKVLEWHSDMVSISMARHFNGEYFGRKIEMHWNQMRRDFPRVFDKGNRKQSLYDQYWIQYKGYDVWMGKLVYTIDRGKGRKVRTEVITKQVFCVHMPESDRSDKEMHAGEDYYPEKECVFIVSNDLFFQRPVSNLIRKGVLKKRDIKSFEQKLCSTFNVLDPANRINEKK